MQRKPTILGLAAAIMLLFVLSSSAEAQERSKRGRRGRIPQRAPDRIDEGDRAPDFKLQTLDGEQEVQLSSARGERPVALIFGSYT